MIDDRKSFEDPAIIDRYLETLPQADTSYRGRLRKQLAAVFVEDANGSHRRRITGWGEWSTSAHWSPDGNWILFDKVSLSSTSGAHDLFIVHPNGTGLKKIIPAPSGAGGQCCGVWSPNGKKVLVGRSQYLWTANWNGSGLSQLTHAVGDDGYTWGR